MPLPEDNKYYFCFTKIYCFYQIIICASYSHRGIIRVCGSCIICVEEMLQYVWCTKAKALRLHIWEAQRFAQAS